jgi:hypothetical protein
MSLTDAVASPSAHRKFGVTSNRSKVTNGKDLLPGDVDGRSSLARRFRDITNQVLADQGGAERCSEARLQLIRRFAAAAVFAEQLESEYVLGQEIDIERHSVLCSTLVRLGQRIGLSRIPKTVPTLADYLDAVRDARQDVAGAFSEASGSQTPANGKVSPASPARSPEGMP